MTKKRFLILTENIGRTAPGIVFERLIGEIALQHETVVVCLQDLTLGECVRDKGRSYTRPTQNSAFFTPKFKARLSRLSLGILGDDWSARLNAIELGRVFEQFVAPVEKFDYILSLVSFRHTSPLLLAEKLVRAGVASANAAYFVDAIPAPLGWSSNNHEFRGLKIYATRRMERLDAIFSSNAQMLEYQVGLLPGRRPPISGVLFNPIAGEAKQLPLQQTRQYNFLYAGGIYGKRTAKHHLAALKKVLKYNKNVFLIFVGAQIQEAELSVLDDAEQAHVVFHPFTANLDPLYQEAVALVDIDADMNDDVFLSSKVTNYLQINRLILSETGENSPASRLFSGIQSIVQCGHDADEIADCMLKVIDKYRTADFDDRAPLIEAFSVRSVVDQMNRLLGLSVE